MVLALLARRKRQTRRLVSRNNCYVDEAVIRNPEAWSAIQRGRWVAMHDEIVAITEPTPGHELRHTIRPRLQVGDVLWVREMIERTAPLGGRLVARYVADKLPVWGVDTWPWQRPLLPSIHMPRGMCRLQLKVTQIRPQRLNDISEDDARAEGVVIPHEPSDCWDSSHRLAFQHLWNELHGWNPPAWDLNPWVFAYSFTVNQGDTTP